MRETVERISLAEANRYLGLSEIGLDGHYLGPIDRHLPGMIIVATAARDAIAVFRCPIPPSHNRALKPCLELSRSWRADCFDDGSRKADRRGVLRPVRQLSGFLAASLRWLRAAAPDVTIVIAYSDTDARSTLIRPRSGLGLRHAGGVYRAIHGFEYVGEQPEGEPHWIDGDGRRINRQKVYRMLGTAARARVAAAQPGWRYVPGSPKLAFMYPMALTVAEALERLAAVPRAETSRPFDWVIQAPPEPWD